MDDIDVALQQLLDGKEPSAASRHFLRLSGDAIEVGGSFAQELLDHLQIAT